MSCCRPQVEPPAAPPEEATARATSSSSRNSSSSTASRHPPARRPPRQPPHGSLGPLRTPSGRRRPRVHTLTSFPFYLSSPPSTASHGEPPSSQTPQIDSPHWRGALATVSPPPLAADRPDLVVQHRRHHGSEAPLSLAMGLKAELVGPC
jgi:hypothetical protein